MNNTPTARGKFAGYIAFYNKEQLEISKDQCASMYEAHQYAVAHFNVPKTKRGLLSIEPAYED